MNFQDLFARYREMGVMAPQQSVDEQSLTRSQNLPTTWWTFFDYDPVDFSTDVPSEKSAAGNRKENVTVKLPTPNIFNPFAENMNEDQEKSLFHDDKVEDFLQSLPPQQKLNLAFLKTSSLCKDYYKLTTNMIHALVTGITEFADGDIAASWQVAQLQGKVHQKQNDLSNAFLQGVMADRSTRFCNLMSSNDIHEEVIRSQVLREHAADVEGKTSRNLPTIFGSQYLQNAREMNEVPLPKEEAMGERYSRDMDSFSELRNLLWKQIFPFTHLGNNLDQRHEGAVEKKLKVIQEKRMKILNLGGLVPAAKSYNSAAGQPCQISDLSDSQYINNRESDQTFSLPKSPESEVHESDQGVTSWVAFQTKPDNSESECITSNCDHELENNDSEEKMDNDDNCAKHGGSNIDIMATKLRERNDYQQLENHDDGNSKHPPDATTNRPLKQTLSRSKCKRDIRFEDSDRSEPERTSHLFTETKCCADGNLPAFDGDFEIVEQEIESPRESAVTVGGLRDEKLRLNKGKVNEQRATRYKENAFPPRSSTKTWCIVGGFTTRSRTMFK